MTTLSLSHFLLTSAIIFVIGLIGFVTRRNMIVMFLCTELMFQAAAIAMVAFGHYHVDVSGGGNCPFPAYPGDRRLQPDRLRRWRSDVLAVTPRRRGYRYLIARGR